MISCELFIAYNKFTNYYLTYHATKIINSSENNVNLKKIALPASCHRRRAAQTTNTNTTKQSP